MKNFFKKETAADKVRAEISSMEFKKNSILAVIQSEKHDVENEKTKVLCSIGTYAYNQNETGNTQYDFTEHFNEIKELNLQLSLKNDKEVEMCNRYDEEIIMLKANLDMLEPLVTDTASEDKVFCENCGKPAMKTDVFCQFCGSKISG